MARVFDGSTQWAIHAAGIRTTVPLSMACWFRPANVTQTAVLMIQSETANNDGFYLMMDGTSMMGRTSAGGLTDDARLESVVTANAWQHGCFVSSATNARAIYHNGTRGTDGTGTLTPSGINQTTLADLGSGFWQFNGRLARAAIWNVALSDADVAALYSRGMAVSPALVRPEGLVAWWDLIGKYSPEIDAVGGFDMTLTASPTAADGPRLAGHRRRVNPFAAAGAAADAVPVCWAQYRRRAG